MSDVLDTVLLLALPASGKSEVRKFLAGIPADELRRDYHLGPMVELDDFPYVHLMRRIDEELARMGRPAIFYASVNGPFAERRDWGTLIELLDQDHADLRERRRFSGPSAAARLLERFDQARVRVGARPELAELPADVRARLCDALEPDARKQVRDREETWAEDLAGKTLVIEFARGGPEGAAMPLPAPYGYAYSLSRLAPEILERAAVLYVWVAPEESRRKNRERANPDDPGSILHHGVPEVVMREDYGCDDIDHLLAGSGQPGAIRLAAHGRSFVVPCARFDNRVDKTSFVRGDRAAWKAEDVGALAGGLRGALDELFRRTRG